MNKTYDTLLRLPLFLGMGREELTDIVGYTRLGFHKCAAGETIVSEHDSCRALMFLLDGEVTVAKCSDSHSYTITEYLTAPLLLEPERLFGLYQHYSRTYAAATDCALLTIAKADALTLCQNHTIFLLNLVSLVSTTAQRQQGRLWHNASPTIAQRIVDFLLERMLTAKGRKTVSIKMQTLATAIRESRLNVSRVLNGWHDKGVVTIGRACMEIPAMERLVQEVREHAEHG